MGDTEPDRWPRASRRRFLRGAAALTVGAVAGCLDDLDGAVGPTDASPTGGSPATDGDVDEEVAAYEGAIHDRVNEIRRDHDLDPLGFNAEIAAVARAHSADMAERDYFAHRSPDGEGPDDRLDGFFPGHCREIGENIAKVGRGLDPAPAAVAERVVSGWMASPGHRENVLRGGFDEEGIGVAVDEDDTVLATQNFCTTNGFLG